MRKIVFGLVAGLAALFPTDQTAHADEPRPNLNWETRSTPGAELDGLSDDLFGERVDPHIGGISFSVVDVSLPGNFALPVEIRRTLTQGRIYHPTETAAFGDWELDIPRITFSYIGEAPTTGRCTTRAKRRFENRIITFSAGPSDLQGIRMEPEDYGADLKLSMNGGTEHIADRREAGGSDGDFFPSSATHATKSNWYFTCITASDGSEGFLGHAPDGSTYKFDHVVKKRTVSPFRAERTWNNVGQDERIMTKVNLLVTRVEDRNKNYVDYSYKSPINSFEQDSRLRSIKASDGRVISLNYSREVPLPQIPFVNGPSIADEHKLIRSVTANGRRWNYSYRSTDFNFESWERDETFGDIPLATLQSVRLPDNTRWTYDFDEMMVVGSPTSDCGRVSDIFTISAKHPLGAELKIKLQEQYHRLSSGKSHQIYRHCTSYLEDSQFGDPRPIRVAHASKMSVTEKVIDIGDTEYKWRYDYENDLSNKDENHSNQVNTTVITGPVNEVVYDHFWSELSGNNPHGDGQIADMKVKELSSGKLLESTRYEWYRERPIGFIFAERNFGGRGSYSRLANLRKSTRVRYYGNGTDTFTNVYSYGSTHNSRSYSFGAPTKVVTTTNVTGGGKTTVTTYEHKRSPWVVALPSKVLVNNREVSRTNYDSLGRATASYAFNALTASYAYHDAVGQKGALKTSTDAINRATYFDSWFRGKPTKVRQPDGSTIQMSVTSNGWIQSITDGRNQKTSYSHDPMGRLKRVTPPGPFVRTDISYSFPSSKGIIQTTTRGQSVNTVTYDALARVTRNQAQSQDTGWSSFVNHRYDGGSRRVFSSFPSSSASGSVGTTFEYDGLSRMVKSRETVSPNVTTQTSFYRDNKVTVTNPDGFRVSTWRYGWDGPDSGPIRAIYRYGGNSGLERTHTYHNVFGELSRVRRLATGGTAERTQYNYYDSRSRLCRARTDEGGDTLYQYNNANEITAWSKGHAAGTACASPQGTTRVTQSYDGMSRPLFTNFADNSTPDITRKYDKAGNMETLNRGSGVRAVNWSYNYGPLNNVTSQVLRMDGRTFSMAYAYDGNANLISRKLPNGETVNYDRNAIGQLAGVNLAGLQMAHTGRYHPSGALASMTYGNAQRFTQTLTSRLQPLRMRSAKPGGHTALDLQYAYNKRGLITHTTDRAVSGQNRTYGYDGLSRLVKAGGSWGSADYTYDSLGNLLTKKVGARTVTLSYDSRNRVSRSVDTGESGNRSLQHDSRGNVTKLGGLVFSYDASDRATSVRGTTGGVATPPPPPPPPPPPFPSPGDPSPYPDPICGNVFCLNPEPFARTDGEGPLEFDFSSLNETKASPPINLTYYYDGHGRRVKVASPTKTIYNIFDASGSLLYVEESAGFIGQKGYSVEKTSYVDGPMGTLARVKGAGSGRQVTYLHPDHLGSAQSGTNSSGSVVWRESYTPFGETLKRPADNKNQAGFTGHINDAETKLTYMQARYMDPVMGRFLSIDPVTFSMTGDPRYFNRYSYTANDPVNATDPTGMYTKYHGTTADSPVENRTFENSLTEGGIENVEAVGNDRTSGWGTGQNAKIINAIGVNQNSPRLREQGAKQFSTPNNIGEGEQNNIVGLSFGTLTGSFEALGRADNGEFIDNLVLVGAPMNESLLTALQGHDNIGQVLIYNLPGDPLVPPMTDMQIIGAAGELGGESRRNRTGHHSLSGPTNETNRQNFVKFMRDNGVR